MSKERNILFKAVIRAFIIACLSVIGVYLIFIILFFLPSGRLVSDIGGGFRNSCRNLTGQKLTVEALRTLDGSIRDYRFGKNREVVEFNTKNFSEELLSIYNNYIEESKKCVAQEISSHVCTAFDKESYNKLIIINGALQNSWRCTITIEDETFIMKAQADYFFDD